ncbi:hypothetical protein GCM10028827_28300 [Mucilaginibacter myungsuensis]
MDFQPKWKNTIGVAVVMAAVALSYAFTIAGPAGVAKRSAKFGVNYCPADTDLLLSDPAKSVKIIADSLANLKRRLPIEKVYLHTDKAYYNIGDTLWLKAYVTDAGNRPSKHSALLYVEMYDDSADVMRRISIPIKEGLGMAQIPLPLKVFKEGGYTLRAYTNWMNNFGSDYFFTHRFYLGMPTQATWLVKSTAAIEHVGDKDRLDVEVKLHLGDRKPVSLSNVEVKIYEGRYYLFKEKMRTGIDGSLNFSKLLKNKVDGRDLNIQITSLDKAYPNKVIRIPLVINRDAKIDLQFLPEGGKLVTGIPSTVGFKAIGEDGKGIDVKATIQDGKGNKVADISSFYNGMGSFKFTPEAGQSYVAKISGGRSNNKTYNLPAVNATGVVMHVDNPEQDGDIKVNVKASVNISPDSSYHLQGMMNGRIYYTERITAKNSDLNISKMTFPSGIARFTLFKGLTPIAERMVFVDHKDRLDIRVTQNKANYQKRDSVSLDIEVKDATGIPVQGSFSLSVTDNTQVKPDTIGNFGIATQLLLKSGLKSDVETPGYYLHRKDAKAWQALDNLMLTQGWTAYDWKDVFAPATKPKFVVEKDLSVTGTVVNVANKPVPDVSVLISSQKPQYTAIAFTDKDGRYLFKNLPQTDSGSFFLQGNNKKGKMIAFGDITVDKINIPNVPEMYRTPIMPWFVNSDTSQLDYIKRVAQKAAILADPVGEGTMLKNVTISKARIIPGGELNGRTDLGFDEAEIKESTTQNLYQLLKQKIPGFGIRHERAYHGGGATMRMDGYRMVGGVREYSEHFINFIVIDGKEVGFEKEDPYSIEEYKQRLSEVIVPNLKTLEIVWSPEFIPARYNYLKRLDYYVCMIFINTRSGGVYVKAKNGTTTYRPLPVMQPKQFYSPRYKANAATPIPDYRSTIHWEPQLYTDINGKAKIWFYTSDLPKDYTINIQGMGQEGEMGSLVQKIGNASVTTAGKP